MKVALKQIALPVGVTSFDITDAGITSDWKGAIFFGGEPTANDSMTAGANFWIGAVDSAGRNWVLSVCAGDAIAATPAGVQSSAIYSYYRVYVTAGSNAQNGKGAYSATLSNGVTLLPTSATGARLMNALLFSGSDLEFAVSTGSFPGQNLTITHNLTGIPDCVVLLINNGVNVEGFGGGDSYSVGFWDGTNSVGYGGTIKGAANPTSVAAICGSADMGSELTQTPALQDSVTIDTVGAATFRAHRSVNPGRSAGALSIAWRHLSSNAAAYAFVDTTPLSTGNHVVASGLSVAPQLWLNLPTLLTASTFTNDDTAGSWGFSAAVNNNGTTQQGAVASSFKHNVATSVAKSQVSNSAGSLKLTSAGAVDFKSSVATWDAGGVTENVGTAASSAGKRINLVYGISGAYVPSNSRRGFLGPTAPFGRLV